jgi:hypothetical protein
MNRYRVTRLAAIVVFGVIAVAILASCSSAGAAGAGRVDNWWQCDQYPDSWACRPAPEGADLSHAAERNHWWGKPIMCMNISMKEARWYGDLDCLYRNEMPVPRRRPRKTPR